MKSFFSANSSNTATTTNTLNSGITNILEDSIENNQAIEVSKKPKAYKQKIDLIWEEINERFAIKRLCGYKLSQISLGFSSDSKPCVVLELNFVTLETEEYLSQIKLANKEYNSLVKLIDYIIASNKNMKKYFLPIGKYTGFTLWFSEDNKHKIEMHFNPNNKKAFEN